MAWLRSEAPTMVTRLNAGSVEYRLEQRGDMSVVIFHGGHMRAGLALGEEVFAEAGYTLLVPSRPGYGRTPLSTGTSVSGFCDVTRALCGQLGITRIAAVVGISGGGPTAVTMAARHPDLVQRLILQSAVGWLSYPDRRARLGAHAIFTATTERFTWATIRALMRRGPNTGLRIMLSGLSTLPVRDVMAALSPEDRAMVIDLFCRMRSGHGFINDLRPTPDATGEIDQPTLVIATRNDGGVPFAHAESLAAAICHATLVQSQADTHLIWLGHDWPAIADRIGDFLTTELPHPPSTAPHA